MRRFCCISALLLLLGFSSRAEAGVTWNVTVTDTIGGYSALIPTMVQHAQIAGQTWSNAIQTAANVSMEVHVSIEQTPSNRGGGGSATGFFVGRRNGINVFEQSAARELKSGIDPNGATADIFIELDPDYIDTQMWWDPSPSTRTATVPNNRIDDMSVWLHELGHAIAFNGWRDWTTAVLPAGSGQSPFDELVSTVGGNHFFNGAQAMALYGGPVPLRAGNLYHFGNPAPGLGTDLGPDLMTGHNFNWGQRYGITALDLAALRDMAIPTVPVPEPAVASLGVCIALALTMRRAQSRPARIGT